MGNSSTKEVIIHAGFHKTASSSIQHSLSKNRDLLAQHGFHYPDIQINGGKRFYNQSVPLFGLYTENPENFKHYWYHNNLDHVTANQLLQNHFESELWKHDKLVFSDEFFSRLSISEMRKAKNEFQSRGYKIRVISYIREPFNLMTSVVQQQAKAYSVKVALLNERPSEEFNKIANLIEVFSGSAEFHNFEQACKHSAGPAGFFFDLLNISLQPENTVRVNDGVSMQVVRLVSHINSVCPLFLSQSTLNPLRSPLDLGPILGIKGDRFKLTEEEVEMVLPQIDKARKNISEVLGQNFLPEGNIVTARSPLKWDAEQIMALVTASSQLNLNLLLRIHDYFLASDEHELEYDKPAFAQLENIIKQRLIAEAAETRGEKNHRPSFWRQLGERLFA